ncbi:MAG: AraC family transcriptional regulator [Neomegalonema sp.]|nr:AraC family transcriptional regulator [Neomegalonema sp.]
MASAAGTNHITDRLRVSVGVCRGLPEFTREFGVDINAVAKALNLDCQVLQRFDQFISFDKYCRLLESIATICGDEIFGLKFGDYFGLGGSGPFGYGLKSAPDLRHQLEFTVKYYQCYASLEYTSLERTRTQARIEWGVSPMIIKVDQYTDFSTRLFLRHLQLCAGKGWLPRAAELQRGAPPNKTAHRRLISPQIQFQADANALIIDSQALDRPNPHSDPVLFEMMTAKCAEIRAGIPTHVDFRGKVEEEVLAMLGSTPPSTAKVAARLGMSERSLQRRLAEVDLTFQELVDSVRRELSDRLLTDSQLSISEVAYRLGFSAPSAYTRSAARWYGATPSEVRRRHL